MHVPSIELCDFCRRVSYGEAVESIRRLVEGGRSKEFS